MKDPIFNPIKINKLEIKNRICMPAMHLNMAENFLVTDTLVDFYSERARGGAGLIVVGFATVDDLSGGTTNIGAHKDEHIPGLARLATAIKENGACCAVQINQAGKNSHPMLIDGKTPVAPSAVLSPLTREIPREMETEEVPLFIDNFAQAALRVKKAGFDAVEVLAGTGYLISSFLSPLTNLRTDEWGGSFENRMKFGIETIKAVRAIVGDDYPIIVRMNGNDLMPSGVGREQLQVFAQKLVDAGTNAISINVGWHEAKTPQIVTSVPRGAYAYLAKGMKEKLHVPVFAGHRVHNAETARRLISDDMCDMVAMGRALITDPQMPNKVQQGKEHEVVHCIACAQGCFDRLFILQKIGCLCNPRAGREEECKIEKASKAKKVMVIGGGAAGMSAALAAHERGHDVTIYESSDILGGQLYVAAAPPGRGEFAGLAQDLARQVETKNITVKYGQSVDESLLKSEKPDHVILSTGAKPLELPIPGVESANVFQSWDVLTDKVITGKKVVVIGGGAVGVEVALHLAEKGTLSGEELKFLFVNKVETPEDLYKMVTQGSKEVVVIEMLKKVGKDIGRSTRWVMMQDLGRYGVTTKTDTKALEITDQGVKIENEDGTRLIEADSVVIAAGSVSVNILQPILDSKGISFDVVGDANQIGLAYNAIYDGFEAGRVI